MKHPVPAGCGRQRSPNPRQAARQRRQGRSLRCRRTTTALTIRATPMGSTTKVISTYRRRWAGDRDQPEPRRVAERRRLRQHLSLAGAACGALLMKDHSSVAAKLEIACTKV